MMTTKGSTIKSRALLYKYTMIEFYYKSKKLIFLFSKWNLREALLYMIFSTFILIFCS